MLNSVSAAKFCVSQPGVRSFEHDPLSLQDRQLMLDTQGHRCAYANDASLRYSHSVWHTGMYLSDEHGGVDISHRHARHALSRKEARVVGFWCQRSHPKCLRRGATRRRQVAERIADGQPHLLLAGGNLLQPPPATRRRMRVKRAATRLDAIELAKLAPVLAPVLIGRNLVVQRHTGGEHSRCKTDSMYLLCSSSEPLLPGGGGGLVGGGAAATCSRAMMSIVLIGWLCVCMMSSSVESSKDCRSAPNGRMSDPVRTRSLSKKVVMKAVFAGSLFTKPFGKFKPTIKPSTLYPACSAHCARPVFVHRVHA